jgi:hypothetical protein
VSISPEASVQPSERHEAAVHNSLGWAQESADRGDYADALLWLHVIEATGEPIPPAYCAKRLLWAKHLTQLIGGSKCCG